MGRGRGLTFVRPPTPASCHPRPPGFFSRTPGNAGHPCLCGQGVFFCFRGRRPRFNLCLFSHPCLLPYKATRLFQSCAWQCRASLPLRAGREFSPLGRRGTTQWFSTEPVLLAFPVQCVGTKATWDLGPLLGTPFPQGFFHKTLFMLRV